MSRTVLPILLPLALHHIFNLLNVNLEPINTLLHHRLLIYVEVIEHCPNLELSLLLHQRFRLHLLFDRLRYLEWVLLILDYLLMNLLQLYLCLLHRVHLHLLQAFHTTSFLGDAVLHLRKLMLHFACVVWRGQRCTERAGKRGKSGFPDSSTIGIGSRGDWGAGKLRIGVLIINGALGDTGKELGVVHALPGYSRMAWQGSERASDCIRLPSGGWDDTRATRDNVNVCVLMLMHDSQGLSDSIEIF